MDFLAASEELVVERMEQEVRRRTTEGNRRYKFTTKGEPIIDPRTGGQYHEHVHLDLLAIFMLKVAKPERYHDDAGSKTTVIGKSITLHQ